MTTLNQTQIEDRPLLRKQEKQARKEKELFEKESVVYKHHCKIYWYIPLLRNCSIFHHSMCFSRGWALLCPRKQEHSRKKNHCKITQEYCETRCITDLSAGHDPDASRKSLYIHISMGYTSNDRKLYHNLSIWSVFASCTFLHV